jgi:hypothetical protein
MAMKHTKWPWNIPNGHETSQMVVKYSEWPWNIPMFSIPRPVKIFPNRIFGLKIKHLATLDSKAVCRWHSRSGWNMVAHLADADA